MESVKKQSPAPDVTKDATNGANPADQKADGNSKDSGNKPPAPAIGPEHVPGPNETPTSPANPSSTRLADRPAATPPRRHRDRLGEGSDARVDT